MASPLMKKPQGLLTVIVLLALLICQQSSLAQSDVQAEFLALIGELPPEPQLLEPDTTPIYGTFFMLSDFQHDSEGPPYPCNPFPGASVFSTIATDVYIVDDSEARPEAFQPVTDVDLTTVKIWGRVQALIAKIQWLREQRSMKSSSSMQVMTLGLDPSDPANWDTNGWYQGGSYLSRVYGSNELYLVIDTVSNGWAYVDIMHSSSNSLYEILSTADLRLPITSWSSEGYVQGVEGATATMLQVQNRTNLFLCVRDVGLDSEGGGVPDWWQLAYFGQLGVDPYGDPDHDGWNTIQEFQNGTHPNSFNQPPAPSGFTVRYNSSNNVVTVSWIPSSGSVTGYTIVKLGDETGEFHVNHPAQTLTDTVTGQPYYPGYFGPGLDVSYRIQAHFQEGDSAWSGLAYIEPNFNSSYPVQANLPISVAPGTNGTVWLAVGALPPGSISIRIKRIDVTANNSFGDTSFDREWELPVASVIKGLYPLPLEIVSGPPDGYGYANYRWWAYVLDQNSQPTAAVDLGGSVSGFEGQLVTPFLDGRRQLKENLAFLLRVANAQLPFEFYLDRSAGRMIFSYPSDYAYATYYDLTDWVNVYDRYLHEGVLTPFRDNYLFRNFAFSTANVNSVGALNGFSYSTYLKLSYPPTNLFQGPTTNGANISARLSSADTQWTYFFPLYSAWPLSDIGVSYNGSSCSMASNVRNLYGLPYLSAKLAYSVNGILTTPTITAGGSSVGASSPFYIYPEAAQPQLQTTNYYFTKVPRNFPYSPGLTPVPGQSNFSLTNVSPLLVTGIGQKDFKVAGYAKQGIVNGYANKFGYLGQYFDKAYTMNASGVATTNSAGVLSPYGDFFPTQPGPAALVTMPDIDYPTQRGTGVVHVISMNVDASHDGAMDCTYWGPDQTSAARPFRFWANNDRDDVGSATNLDHDVYLQPDTATNNCDYSFGQIRSMRNLEDFARLWICGMPTLPASQGYSVQIGWSQIDSGAPKLRLYRATETNGGIGYLTNITIVSQQIIDYNYPIGEVTPTSSLTLPTSWFTNGLNRYFLFEAGAPGKGALTLTIMQGSNVIAQTSAWMDFHDIRDFYEEVAIRDVVQTWPEMVQTNLNSSYTVVSYPTASIGDANQTAVFVHGWRMPYSDYTIFSQTMFKRLYWKGYQGKFATVRWPTRSSDTDPGGLDLTTYNRSEYISFQSATGTALYLYDLRNRFTNDIISVCSHSQGGILMMEALKELAASSVSPVDNYVLMEAAVPAHCYDTTITNLPWLMDMEASIPTPNTYSNYAAGMRSALRGGNICNLFNPADFALVSGLNGTGLGSWESNEELLKPLVFFGYIYLATNQTAYVITNQYTVAFGITNLQNRIVTDPLELMPFVARPHSKAVGAQAGVGNVVNGSEYNLQSQLGFTAATYDHSGQFNRNIQTPQVQGFYSRLLQNLFPPAP